MNQIYLRAFFPADNEDEAEKRIEPFIKFIKSKFDIEKINLEKYWKITENFDLILILRNSTNLSLTDVTTMFGENWRPAGSLGAVLNEKTGGKSYFPYVHWINIDMLEL